MFYHVTSEYDSTFVFLISRFQLWVLKMTKIQQWREMNFSYIIPRFIDHLFLVSDFRQLPCQSFLQFFPILLPLLPLHPELSLLEASEWICEQDCNDSENSTFYKWYDLGDVCVLLLLPLVLCFCWHQQYKGTLSAFPKIAVGFSTALYRYFAWHCCWHRNFQLSTSGFDCELEFLHRLAQ